MPIGEGPAEDGWRGSLMPYLKDEVEFFPHQIDGIRTLAEWKSFISADDMGLGKSLQAITVFAMDAFLGWANTAIVICPTTLKGNWEEEFIKFTNIPTVTLEGTPDERAQILAKFSALTGVKVLIVNYEQVPKILPWINAQKFHVAIFDEAHYIKNPKSKRTQAALAVEAHRNFMLTGSPLLNNVNELWPLLHKVSPEAYPDYWRFVNKYCQKGGYEGRQITGVKNEKLLHSNLKEVMLRRLKRDVLKLKEPFYIDRFVDLTPAQRALYDQAVNDLELPDPNETDPRLIDNALVEFNYLRQICGTSFAFDGQDNSAKNDLAIPDAQELIQNDNKIVVFSQDLNMMTSYIERAKAVMPGLPIFRLDGSVNIRDRVPLVNSVGQIKTSPAILVCNINVAGVGLNMTWSKWCQFLDELFVPALNRQGVDRLNRIGQQEEEPVSVLRYIARNTKDQRIAEILKIKMRVEKDVIDATTDMKRDLFNLIQSKQKVAA